MASWRTWLSDQVGRSPYALGPAESSVRESVSLMVDVEEPSTLDIMEDLG